MHAGWPSPAGTVFRRLRLVGRDIRSGPAGATSCLWSLALDSVAVTITQWMVPDGEGDTGAGGSGSGSGCCTEGGAGAATESGPGPAGPGAPNK